MPVSAKTESVDGDLPWCCHPISSEVQVRLPWLITVALQWGLGSGYSPLPPLMTIRPFSLSEGCSVPGTSTVLQ